MSVKKEIVENIKGLSADNNCLLIVDYKGVDAQTMSAFRGELLTKCGTKMHIAKNTLFKVAVGDTDYSKVGKTSGQCGYIFCNDFLGVSKVINDYCFNKKNFKFVSCISEGEVKDESYVREMASLPTLDVVRQKIMCAINSVGSSLLYVMSKKYDSENKSGE